MFFCHSSMCLIYKSEGSVANAGGTVQQLCNEWVTRMFNVISETLIFSNPSQSRYSTSPEQPWRIGAEMDVEIKV